ncbi:hypothetical protein ACUYO0_004151 [Vibrio vulnificus]
MRDLGLMGESAFTKWCAEVGLIPNSSNVDKTGWDFYVEFPLSSYTNDIDMQTAPIECKVQVKATDKQDRKLPITLSNLIRMVKAPLPTFFVFIEFDGLSDPQRTYLVHVDDSLIAKTLERIREVDQSDSENNLNKRKMTVYYGDEHKLDSNTGHDLKKSLKKYIPDGMEAYVSLKQRFLSDLGYEHGRAQMQFTTVGEENLQKLVDVSLGLERSVDISNVVARHLRFGILSKEAINNSENATIEMPNVEPLTKGKIKFKKSSFSPADVFYCNLYTSPFYRVLPKRMIKFRVEGSFFNFVIFPFTGVANYSFSLDGVQLTLNEMKSALKVLSILYDSSDGYLVEFDFEGLSNFSFRLGKKTDDSSWDIDRALIENAMYLADFFELPYGATTSLTDLENHANSIDEFRRVLEVEPQFLNIEFSVFERNISNLDKVCCQFFLSVNICGYSVGCILSVAGKAVELESNRYRIVPSSVAIDRKLVCSIDSPITSDVVLQEFDIACKRYEDEGFSVVRMSN